MSAAVPSPDPSSLRVACEHAFECAGCPLIDQTYAEQLRLKHERVAAAFARYAATSRIEPVLGATRIEGYRGRAKLIVSNDGKIGLFAKNGGHRVVDTPGCRVMTPTIARVTAKLREIVRADSAASAIRAFDLREVENPTPKVLVTFVVDRQTAPPHSELQRLADELRASEPAVVGVAANFRETDAPQVLGDVTTHLSGATQAADAHGRSTHLATYGSFVQAHRDQAACVHDLVLSTTRKIQKKSPALLDLYGGSGAIGLALAKAGAVVELVESFPPAVERARDAAKSQGLKLHGTASDVARALRDFSAKNRRFDAAITNPPRRGMSPDARERLADIGPPVIVYVSCDPETLARDLAHLALRSYVADKLQPVDMMPLTEEVETVATLTRASPPPARVLFEDEEILAVAKEGHETMHGLETRVRNENGAAAAVAVSSLATTSSGVVLFVRDPAHAETWRAALARETATVSFVAACRGISREKGLISRHKGDRGGAARYRRLTVAGGHSILRAVVSGAGAARASDSIAKTRLSEIGHPVLGDPKSCDPRSNRFFEERNALDRPFLHAVRVELDRPGSGTRLVVSAPLAGDLRTTLERMGGRDVALRLEEKNALGGSPNVTS